MLPPGVFVQNRYQILRQLGMGGMGAVYLAQDSRLGQLVALKENIGGDPRQFQQEAFLLANLRHPGLPRVIDHFVDTSTGTQYLVMDYVDGEDLESRIARQGALPEAYALAWFDQIMDAVAYLHSRGVIHRDIKPANIKITPAGQAVLVDFGIAKVFRPGQRTATGARLGTPGFAAPEQYGGGTDQRSDIYSLGATLYALLTGQVPPDALTIAGRSAMLMPPRTLNPALSVQTERIILRAMTLGSDQRFQTVDELRQLLKATRILPTVSVSPQKIVPISLAHRSHIPISAVVAWIGLCALFFVVGVLLLVGSFLTMPPAVLALATRTPAPTATDSIVMPKETMIIQTATDSIIAPTETIPIQTATAADTLIPSHATPIVTRTRLVTVTRRAGTPTQLPTKQPTQLPTSPTPVFRVLTLADTLLLFQSPIGLSNANLSGGYISNGRMLSISEGDLDLQSGKRHVKIKVAIEGPNYADGMLKDTTGQQYPFPLYSTVNGEEIGQSKIEWPVQVVDGGFVIDCWVEERVLQLSP